MSEMTQVLGTVAMEPKGEWNSETYYEKLNTVLYNDSTYMAKESVVGENPSTSSKWQLIGGGTKKEDTTLVFDTVAEMKAADLKDGYTALTLGYYETNDGGGATYKITDTESQTEHQEEVGDLYATLITYDVINIKQFGAKGDGVTDDSTILNNIFNNIVHDNQIVLFPEGIYLCSNKLVISNLTKAKIDFKGKIKSNNGVLLQNLYRCNINDLYVYRDYTNGDHTTLSNKGLEIINSKYMAIYNPVVEGFEYGFYWHSIDSSNSYNDLYNVHAFNNLHSWYTTNEGSGFTNEIHVFGGRMSLNHGDTSVSGIADLITIPNGTSQHNFISLCLEADFTKIKCNGQYNNFVNCRLEFQDSGQQDVIIGGNNNHLTGCYISEQSGGTKIVNTGLYNQIENSRTIEFNKVIKEKTNVVTSDYTLNRTYNNILCDCTNNNIKITLPPTGVDNFINSTIRIVKIDESTYGVNLFTSGQDSYGAIGRGNILKNANDYVELYFNGSKWSIINIGNLYGTSLTDRNQTNIYQGLLYTDGGKVKVISQGGTQFNNVQITNTYCNTTANSAQITLSINGSNRTLQQGNFITIDGEDGYFVINKLDLTNNLAVLDRNVTQSLTSARIKYIAPITHEILDYEKVASLPSSQGTIGDIVLYDTPVAGGYIGAIYTSNGWKDFGSIAS